MATTVDSLLIDIQADVSKLRRELNRVQRQVKNSTKDMGRNVKGLQGDFGKLGNVIKAVGTFIGVAFGIGQIKEIISVGAEIENLKLRLNGLFGSVEEGGKAFEKMTKFAAKVPFSLQDIQRGGGSLAAVSGDAEELGELLLMTGNIAAQFGMSFQDAASNLQRALSGGAGAADQFRERGVLAFAGFQAGVSMSASETAKILQDTFGTGGTASGSMEQMATMTDGTVSMLGDAVLAFRRQVSESGLQEAFKELTRFLTETTKESQSLATTIGEALASAIRGLTEALRFVRDNLDAFIIAIKVFLSIVIIGKIVNLTLAFVALANGMKATAIAMALVNKVTKKNVFIALAGIITALALSSDQIANAINKASDGVIDFGDDTDALNTELKAVNDTLGKVTIGVTDTEDKLAELNKALEASQKEGHLLSAELMGLNSEFVSLAQKAGLDFSPELGGFAGGADPKVQAVLDDMEKQINKNKRLKLALDKRNESLANAKNAVENLVPPQRELNQLLNDLSLAHKLGKITTDEFNVAMQQTLHEMSMLNPMTAEVQSAMMSMGKSISDSFADMVVEGKFSLEALQDIFKSFVKRMISKAIELAVINRIINSVLKIGGTPAALPEASFPFLAGGGRIGGPTIVGERGPELFIPNTGGVVKNNMDTKNMLGGSPVVVNQSINVDAGVAQTVRAEILTMMPMFKEQAMSAVLDARRRGGSFAATFGG